MEKEEVTKWLSIMKANLNSFPEVSSDKKSEALGEAIRLLKNEQSKEPSSSEKPNKSEIPTSSVDCISREQAIKKADNLTLETGYDNEKVEEMLKELTSITPTRMLKELPSITPIRPKGHWIYDKSFANWRCSKCGETPKTIAYVGTGSFMAEHFKYCNHCGAKMEEVEE